MDLVHMGEGGFGPSPLFTFFFKCKNYVNFFEKNDKTMVKKKHF